MRFPLLGFSYVHAVQFLGPSALKFPTSITVSLQELLVLEADVAARRTHSEFSVVWLFENIPKAQYERLVYKLAE